MSEQLKSLTDVEFQSGEKQSESGASLETSLKTLERFGGFDFIESLIDGADNLNPTKKARGKIFRTDGSKKEQRKELKAKMKVWLDLLAGDAGVAEIVEGTLQKATTAEKLLKTNLKKILAESHDLEESYRSVALFFKNSEASKITNINFMNADIEQVKDLDDQFVVHAEKELGGKFDRFDLRDNYSMLVIPGFLGKNTIVDRWAKIAHENKVTLITDFENVESSAEALSLFIDGNYTSASRQYSNVIMTCNYIVGRGKNTDVDEEEDVYVPGSAALAGKMYCTKLSQPVAGKTFGTLDEVDAVRFDQRKSETSELESVGLVPLVYEWGRVMPFSAKTLFNGDNLGFQTYSVVRVFDFVAKVVADFLNRRAMERWDDNVEGSVRKQIIKFLDNIAGPGNLIEKFHIEQLRANPNQPDQVFIDIHMTPYFVAKSFLVKFDGYKGDDDKVKNWKGELS